MQPRIPQAYLNDTFINPVTQKLQQSIDNLDSYINNSFRVAGLAGQAKQLIIAKLARSNEQEYAEFENKLRELQANPVDDDVRWFEEIDLGDIHFSKNNVDHSFFVGEINLLTFYEIFPESPELAKLALVNKLKLKMVELISAMHYVDFAAEINAVLSYIDEIYPTVSTPRLMRINTSKTPEETAGSKLLNEVAAILDEVRNILQDTYIPANLNEAKQLFFKKIEKAAIDYRLYQNTKKPFFPSAAYLAKIDYLNIIVTEIQGVSVEGEITAAEVERMQLLITEEDSRRLMYSHTFGLFARVTHAPQSDIFMDELINQLHILNLRTAHLNGTVYAPITPRGA